ncbi:MAG: hypothetical protein HQK83_09995 [Fibrobacteria bacterium]|nr:hypothetical protein [Fibrobacteria bacterium]
MKKVTWIICWLFLVIMLQAAEEAVVHARAAFMYPQPDETTDLIKYVKRGEKVKLVETAVDSLERLWYKIIDKKRDTGWVEGHDLKIIHELSASVSDEDDVQNKKPRVSISKLTARERLAYIKQHRNLERRIKKLIKNGFIGLGMSNTEVQASLGPPEIKKTIFLLKKGEIPVWIYNISEPVVIIFEDGKVTGWSRD